MPRFIDADNLLEKLHRMIDYCEEDRKVNAVSVLFQVGDAIMDCKTADVREVRHGRWELIGKNVSKCTVCGCSRNIKTQFGWNFCPVCGAKMGGDERC